MLTVMLASLALAVPPPPGCFGPCVIPNCPQSKFWVCHETPGKTKVYAENGGASVTSTQSNSSTFGVGVLGGVVQPEPGQTWGSVDSCDDLEGYCYI